MTRELGTAPLPASIATFVDGEFEAAAAAFPKAPPAERRRETELAEQFFRRMVAHVWAS